MTEPYINANDYATSGVNDHLAFQAALDAGAGRTVIASGDWVFDDWCVIPASTRLVLYDAHFTCGPSGTGLFYNFTPGVPQLAGYTGNSGILIEGGTLDMRSHENDVAHNCVTFSHCRDITVRDVEFRNISSYHALEPHSVDGMLIDNCQFYGWKNWLGTEYDFREAIQLDSVNKDGDDGSPTTDLTVQNCRFDESTECGGWGTALGSHTVGVDVHRTIKFMNNIVYRNLLFGVRALSWSDVQVTDNRFGSCGRNSVHFDAHANHNATRAIVTENIISYSGLSGVRFEGDGGSWYSSINVASNVITNSDSNAMLFSDVHRGVIAMNQIRSTANWYGIQLGTGSTESVSDLHVTGNHITGTYQEAIRLNYAPGCTVVGNVGSGGISAGGDNSGARTTWDGSFTVPGDNLL